MNRAPQVSHVFYLIEYRASQFIFKRILCDQINRYPKGLFQETLKCKKLPANRLRKLYQQIEVASIGLLIHGIGPKISDFTDMKFVCQFRLKSFQSVVTEYEILIGSNEAQLKYWRAIFNQIKVLPLDSSVINSAVEIHSNLKKKRKQIDVADLFIAATAVRHKMPIATLNKSHFERIETLELHR
jgi:predicted nucleic acid-binding protein